MKGSSFLKSLDQGYRDYLKNIKEKELHMADLRYFIPVAFKKIISKKDILYQDINQIQMYMMLIQEKKWIC